MAAPLQSNNSYCTSGFPVIHKATGRRGITTAAHCPDNLIYGNYATGAGKYTVPLTFVDQINDASHDVQWHTVGSHTPLREVYSTSTSDYSRRRIMYMWTNATQGQSMCFRGVTSQYTCGTVVSIKHSPELACGPTGNLPCADAWIRIEGSSLACGFGDSGAAIFFGDNGYVIVAKASLKDGSCKEFRDALGRSQRIRAGGRRLVAPTKRPAEDAKPACSAGNLRSIFNCLSERARSTSPYSDSAIPVAVINTGVWCRPVCEW